MAFISNEKREGLIKKVNQKYGFRKFIVLLDIILLTGFMIVAFLSWFKQSEGWAWTEFNGTENVLTTFGKGMLAAAAVIIALGIVSVILLFTFKSPKSVKEEMKTLESSPLAGKKIQKDETAGEVMRARRNPLNAISEDKKKEKEEKAKDDKKEKKETKKSKK